MIIPCFRCGKALNSPDASNADYIMASDTVAEEARQVLIAVQLTDKAKAAKTEIESLERAALEIPEDLKLQAAERLRTMVSSIEEAQTMSGLERVEVESRMMPIQKTGVICPDCYRDTDFIIWGVHKK